MSIKIILHGMFMRGDREHWLLKVGDTCRPMLLKFNSIQFIIYVPSQQLQGQLQTQHSVDTIIIIVKQ
jgi:hypothetical protein